MIKPWQAHTADCYPPHHHDRLAILLQAVLLLDVDFGVSSSLSALQADSQQYMQLMWALQQGAALVLPALEAASQQGLQGRDVALKALALGKAFVAEQFR